MVSIDTETTGRDPETDRIVEIACVLYRAGEVIERHHWLVNPGVPIPKEAFDVHGISDDDVKDKPSFAEIADPLAEALRLGVPMAYNAEFDKAFILAEYERSGKKPSPMPAGARKDVEWLDPLIWARELQREEKSKSLSEVCARLGIDIGQAHRATDDAEAAAKVMGAFSSDVRVPKTYAAFIQEQKRLGRIFADERRLWRKN